MSWYRWRFGLLTSLDPSAVLVKIDVQENFEYTFCQAISALTLFWRVVVDEFLKRPSDWSFSRILFQLLVIWPWGLAQGSSSAARWTSRSMSSGLNLDQVWPVGGEVVSWGSIARTGVGGYCTVAVFGKEYGLMMNSAVCIVECGGSDVTKWDSQNQPVQATVDPWLHPQCSSISPQTLNKLTTVPNLSIGGYLGGYFIKILNMCLVGIWVSKLWANCWNPSRINKILYNLKDSHLFILQLKSCIDLSVRFWAHTQWYWCVLLIMCMISHSARWLLNLQTDAKSNSHSQRSPSFLSMSTGSVPTGNGEPAKPSTQWYM